MRVVVVSAGGAWARAGDVVGAVAAGWRASAPAADVRGVILSDGAYGLVESLCAASAGTVRRGPGGYTLLDDAGPTAVLECTDLLGGATSTAPVGEALTEAYSTGVPRIVLGMGRTRVHDGGAGFAAVLSNHFGSLAAACEALAGVDLVVAGSEPVPLLGLHGAGAHLAATLGGEAAQAVDRAVAAFAAGVEAEVAPLDLTTGRRLRLSTAAYSGLGGGCGFLALAVGARAQSGLSHTADAAGLAAALGESDLAVVALGVMDALALEESAAATVGRAALDLACPVVVLTTEDHTSRHQRAALGIVGSYQAGTTGAAALGELARRVARTWTRG